MKVISIAVAALVVGLARAQDAPVLEDGTTFGITVIKAEGFVEKSDAGEYQGYVIDMIKAVAALANFDYDLYTPSGFGSGCSPKLDATSNSTEGVRGEAYESAYLCGQADALEGDVVPTDYQTDMYWSMYFVTTGRQLAGQFSLPFKPPFGGLTMYGTETGIEDIDALIVKQAAGDVGPACVGDNTAYANFLADALPDLDTVGVPNTDDGFLGGMQNGTCTVAINAEHAAVHFVKSRFDSDTCEVGGKPIGVIGAGLKYGLTQMAVGFGKNTSQTVVDTISYHLNALMTCAPGSDGCDDGLYESWKDWAGTGAECGHGGGGTPGTPTPAPGPGGTPEPTPSSGGSAGTARALLLGLGGLFL